MNLMFFGGGIYCLFFGPKEGWGGLSWDAVRNLGECWKLGMAGVVRRPSAPLRWQLAHSPRAGHDRFRVVVRALFLCFRLQL